MVSGPMSESVADRAIARIREEMTTKGLSQADIAGRLAQTESRISRLLTRITPPTIDDLEALCFAVDLRPSEAVRDHGLEWCAEMTPTELRVLTGFRRASREIQDIVTAVLRAKAGAKPDRYASRGHKRGIAKT